MNFGVVILLLVTWNTGNKVPVVQALPTPSLKECVLMAADYDMIVAQDNSDQTPSMQLKDSASCHFIIGGPSEKS